MPTTDADPYFQPRPGDEFEPAVDGTESVPEPPIIPDEDLIYHVDLVTGKHRLCIPTAVVPDILAVAHGNGHPGFQRCYEIISNSWYIRGLTKQLRTYIRHCPDCLILQTRRHQPYGALQPISAPPVPFHTLTIDFILALPKAVHGYDCALSVTCKYTKRTTFVPGQKTHSAA